MSRGEARYKAALKAYNAAALDAGEKTEDGAGELPTAVRMDTVQVYVRREVGRQWSYLVRKDGKLRIRDEHIDICSRYTFLPLYIVFLIVLGSQVKPYDTSGLQLYDAVDRGV